MLLAMGVMSASWQATFFGLACFIFLVIFLISVIRLARTRKSIESWNWFSLAFAFWVFVAFWNALAIATK